MPRRDCVARLAVVAASAVIGFAGGALAHGPGGSRPSHSHGSHHAPPPRVVVPYYIAPVAPPPANVYRVPAWRGVAGQGMTGTNPPAPVQVGPANQWPGQPMGLNQPSLPGGGQPVQGNQAESPEKQEATEEGGGEPGARPPQLPTQQAPKSSDNDD